MIKYSQLMEAIEESTEPEFRPEVNDVQRKHHAGVYQDFIKKTDKEAGATALASGLPKTLRSHLQKYGSASLIGQTIETPHDLGIAGQIHRDPRVESLHMIYTKGNQVVGHNTVSSRMPGSVSPFRTGKYNEDIQNIKNDMHKYGADSYYMLHNHPSGRSTPSDADIRLTKHMNEEIPGLKAHVVVDNTEFHVIHPTGDVDHVEMNRPNHYDLFNKEHHQIPHPTLFNSISGPSDVAGVGKHFEHPEHLTVIGTHGSTGKVHTVAHFPGSLLKGNDTETRKRLEHFSRHSGSSRMFLVVPKVSDMSQYSHHLGSGAFTDIVSHEGKSAREIGIPYDMEKSKPAKQYGSL